ncbi:MAG: hypothetical protein Kow00117_13480 [Phototrophicales bacterium]
MAKSLLNDFPVPTYEEWYQAAVQSLKGAPFEKLTTQTYEEIQLQPLYYSSPNTTHQHTFPGEYPYVRGTHASGYLATPWAIAQEIPYADPQAFNEALRYDLARGQTAVNLRVDASGKRGVIIRSAADLKQALEGVNLAEIQLFIRADEASYDIALMLENPDQITGHIAYDPIAILAEHGQLTIRLEQAYNQMADLLKWRITSAPNMEVIAVHTDVYHNGGANAVQELAFAMATAVAYIRQMTLARSFDLDVTANAICFIFPVGGHFFMEVAKLRAARLLWAQVIKAFGGGQSVQKMKLHTRTSLFNKTLLDPYTNMLRTTLEAFAGAIGGTMSMHVSPFDGVYRQPDEFSRRIARNQQIILQHECNLLSLIDPAGGSYYVETLTHDLAKSAWALFQQIEAQGGMLKALKDGFIQAEVEKVAVQRNENFAKRKDVLIGVNMYPNATDDLPSHQPIEATNVETPFKPIKQYRLAQPFEKLRYAVTDHAAKQGHRPRIFLANMGALKQHKARADFTIGFYEVGGFEMINPPGFDTPEQAAKAALESGAGAVVICSTDDTYPALVPPLVKHIKAANPKVIVILAGYPQDQVEAYQAAGVDDFIHIRANCYDMNYKLLQQMGVIV